MFASIFCSFEHLDNAAELDMARGNVRLLERKLGYGVEPALSKHHRYLKNIQQAMEILKGEYQDLTPKRLRSDASFRRHCGEIFDRDGPRVWTGTCTALDLLSNPEYTRALSYSSDCDKKMCGDRPRS